MFDPKKYTPDDIPFPPIVTATEVSIRIVDVAGLYKPGFNDPDDVKAKTTRGAGYQKGYKSDDGLGRVFYTNFAKIQADLDNPTLGAGHVVPGLAWVLGR